MTWIKYITPLAIALVMAATFPASAGSLPPLINFQSVLLDEGGNLLPSGPTTIQFQILDENHTPIYSESQSVEVIKGAASALIGNGADTKGAPTGGVPDDVFATGAPRYLQVQVGSHAPEDPMTIVPVPYSQWSATCATVADGGVKPASIANAAVGFEALAPDVVSKLADAMSKSQGVVTAQSLSSTGGATQVGVTAKFINSGSTSVQGVLQDIDLSVKKGQETDTFLTGKLNQEVTDRQNAVAGVQGKLDQEVKDRTNSTSGVQSALNKEISDRGIAVAGVQGQITKEISDRGIADTALLNQITPIQSTLQDINNISGTLSLSKVQTSSPPPSDLNMGNHQIKSLAGPTDPKDATTKEYVDQTVANTAQSLPIPVGGVVAGTYVGDGKATKKIALGASITPRVVFLKEPSRTYLANDFALIFSSGLQDHSSYNSSMSEGSNVMWEQPYSNPGSGISSVGVGELTVTGNANVSGITYSYIIIGS